MKKYLTLIASIAAAALVLLSGCFGLSDGRDGRDGKDGQDVTIQAIYEKYVEEYGEISYADFLREYLSYTNEELDSLTGLQSTMNRSLMSGVTVLTRFTFARSSAKGYSGSGVIVWLDKSVGDAYIVTNCHVIYNDSSREIFSTDIGLYLYGQDEYGVNYTYDTSYRTIGDENYRMDAEIVGASVAYDLALLKVTGSEVLKRSDAVAASFSTSADVFVGEYVYAVGNASGEGMSVSSGIISKDSETIELSLSDVNSESYAEYRVIRTTAPINHGNSGGALFNAEGKIVGIVNAKDDSSDVDNMGYALPANNVRRIISLMYDQYELNGNKMKTGGGISKAFLNVQTTVSDSYARYNEQTGRAEITETVRIAAVSGSPARGVLQVGDVIRTASVVGSDGTVKEQITVTRSYHVTEMMFAVRSGDTVKLVFERDGNDVEVEIKFNSNYFSPIA